MTIFSLVFSVFESDEKYSGAKNFCESSSFTDDSCDVSGKIASYDTVKAMKDEGYVPPVGLEVVRIAGKWQNNQWWDDVNRKPGKSSKFMICYNSRGIRF